MSRRVMPLRWKFPPSCSHRRQGVHVEIEKFSNPAGYIAPPATGRAIAIPTLVANPLPSGPVVVSTPVVKWDSGWPGHRLPSAENP